MDNMVKYQQNLSDLGYVIQKLAAIIDKKELTEEEINILNYCEKILIQVNKKIIEEKKQ